MGRRFAKFFELSPLDRWLVIRAVVALVTSKLALVTVTWMRNTDPLRAVRRAAALSQKILPVPMRPACAERMVWAVKAAGRAIPGCTNCLVQAIAAEAILIAAEHPCELRFGVAKGESGEFLAHAWVENEGKMLIGEFERGRFSPLRPPGHHV